MLKNTNHMGCPQTIRKQDQNALGAFVSNMEKCNSKCLTSDALAEWLRCVLPKYMKYMGFPCESLNLSGGASRLATFLSLGYNESQLFWKGFN
ncbi:hypothetical protein V6N13_102991 [Hibiscus sabdariffa]